jgi:PAS domain S-box-containing protein
MQQLATTIRERIDLLVDRYDARLRLMPGYDHLPEALRRDLERHVLGLIAQCLENADHTALIEYVRQRATTWEAQGLPLTAFQQALSIPEELLTPFIQSTEAGNFFWQALNRSQGVVWQMVADHARQAEERFRSIVETSHSGVLIADDAFHLTYVNDELLKISGYAREELLGTDFRQLLDEESRQIVAERYLRRQRGEDVAPRYEVVFRRKDGAKRYIEMSAVSLKDLDGKTHTVAQVLDVTERRQTEQALRSSQQLLQSVMDNIPQAVFWKDRELRYLGCNQAFAEDAGLTTPQDIVGKTDYDMPWTAQAEAYRSDDRLVMELGTAKINYEEPQTTPTGETIWLRTSKVPMRDAAGTVSAVLGMYEDITERKQIESNLQESEERFRRFSEATTEGLVFHDKGVILDANPAIVTMFGFTTASELVGRNLLEFIVPDSRPLVLQKMQLDDVHPYEVECVRKDGLTFPAETATRAYQYGERTVRASAVRDISLRKRLEVQIRESLAHRNVQVQTSVEVAQEIAAAPEESEIFHRVVTLIKERFNYYHAQLFRYDPAQKAVVLIAGYGEAGDKMLAAGHRLPMGRGVVGTAADTGRSILAADVAQDEDWRPNPHLPETKGELAVPIKLRDEVLGILDVQSDRVGTLTDDDRLLLEGLCGQIAIVMESTRLLEQLRRNEAQLSDALRIAQLANWEYEVPTDTFTFNDQFYALLRTTAEREGGYTMSSAQYAQRFVHPEDAPLVGREVQLSIETTDPNFSREIDHRIIYADGEPGYITVRFRIEKDAQGRTVKVYGANQDITARKQIEEALRRDEAELSEALKIAKLGYWEYDVEKDLFHFNDQFYSIFHTTAEQAGGYQISSAQYAQQFVHPDDLPIVGAEIEKALNSSERHYNRKLEHRILYADGGVGHISVDINIDRDEQGHILRYYGANQDITDRKRIEAALAQEQSLMRALMDTVNDHIYFKDAASRFLRVSKSQANRFGLSDPAKATGKTDFDFFTEEHARPAYEDEQEIIRTGQPVIKEERETWADRPDTWVLTSKFPLRDEANNIVGTFGISVDITERKQAEARLQELFDNVQQSERLMRTVIDSTPDWIFIKDREHRYRLVNQGYATALHLQPDDFIGKNDLELGFPEELVKGDPDKGLRGFWADDRLVMDSGETQVYASDPATIDGVVHIFNTIKTPLRDADGKIWGVLAFARDITERERLMAEQQKRAVQLQTASEVSRAASSILDLNELLPQAAELIRERFSLYYVGIFLMDDTGRWATLHAGTGEAGRQMLINGHKLKIGGNSMISQCIELQQARIALDVGEAAVRFDNPLLPLTRSEMALPLIARGRVMGAMTIQSDQPAAFSAEDITVLQSMADQISNAVENARLYEQARTALQEVDAINRRLTGEAWDTYLRQQTGREVIWLADDDTTAPEPLAQLDEQLTTGEITVEPDPDDESEATVTAPILLRGQPIGALRLRTPLSEWSEDTQVMLSDITGHIAQAVENARLIEQTQRTAQRERMINEINARVRQSVDLEAILRTAVNELGQSLKAARVVARVGTMTADGAAVAAGDGRGKTHD